MAKSGSPRVCIIGAGIAGLTSAKCLKDEGIDFTVFECTKYVGGMWRYDGRFETDINNLILHTHMFFDARVNLPYPTMDLRGFPTKKHMHFFPPAMLYYYYIQSYAEHFELQKNIQFHQNVTSVRREGSVWNVKHTNVRDGTEHEDEFDFVIVGTGHFSNPNRPEIPNEKIFKGNIIHSSIYNDHYDYAERRVLIVGAGNTAWDVIIEVIKHVKTLVHSHHSTQDFRTPFPEHYIRKPDIKEFKEDGVLFVDGTYEEVDDVIYCTGYNFTYPFLDETSGLTVNKDHVFPLYRRLVNIKEPSMVVMGLLRRACHVIALDAQARYTTALIKGDFTLPSKEHMFNVWQKEVDVINSNGQPMSDLHLLGDKEDEYYKELSDESGIDRVPRIMSKLRAVSNETKLDNVFTYREYIYQVIDSKTFSRTERVTKRERLAGRTGETVVFVADDEL